MFLGGYMKKKLGILCLSTLLLAGCGIPKLENGQEAVVSFKDDEAISVDDLYKDIKKNYALMSLITMIDTHIYEKEFKDYVESAKSQAKNQVETMKNTYYQSDEEFLQALQSYGYSSVEAFQEVTYMSILEQKAQEEYAKVLVTDKEIEKYYKEKAKGDVEISHILITPEVNSDMSDEEKTKAEDAAKKKAEDLIKQLQSSENVTEDFAKLAKENSQDATNKDKGGVLDKMNYLDYPDHKYDELLDAAYKIKDGEVYSKVVKSENGYHVILKTKSYDLAKLEDIKDDIIEYLAYDLKTNTKDISVKTSQYYRDKYKMKIEDSELSKQYDSYMKRLLASFNATKTNTDTKE